MGSQLTEYTLSDMMPSANGRAKQPAEKSLHEALGFRRVALSLNRPEGLVFQSHDTVPQSLP
jgi:hypothetical protein